MRLCCFLLRLAEVDECLEKLGGDPGQSSVLELSEPRLLALCQTGVRPFG